MIELEALDEPPLGDGRFVGQTCQARHDDLGKCNRKAGHEARGDVWHHTVTDYDPANHTGQHWRWKEA